MAARGDAPGDSASEIAVVALSPRMLRRFISGRRFRVYITIRMPSSISGSDTISTQTMTAHTITAST